MTKKAVILLAKGFEETEAVVPADILKRAEVQVVIAGIGGEEIEGAHGIVFKADTVFNGCDGSEDALILPGGMPGAENLASSGKVKDAIVKLNLSGKIVAAICASPAVVLEPTGILRNREAACYPGMEKAFSSEVIPSEDKVVVSGNVITSRGPGTAFDFGIKLAELLAGKAKAEMVAEQMLF